MNFSICGCHSETWHLNCCWTTMELTVSEEFIRSHTYNTCTFSPLFGSPPLSQSLWTNCGVTNFHFTFYSLTFQRVLLLCFIRKLLTVFHFSLPPLFASLPLLWALSGRVKVRGVSGRYWSALVKVWARSSATSIHLPLVFPFLSKPVHVLLLLSLFLLLLLFFLPQGNESEWNWFTVQGSVWCFIRSLMLIRLRWISTSLPHCTYKCSVPLIFTEVTTLLFTDDQNSTSVQSSALAWPQRPNLHSFKLTTQPCPVRKQSIIIKALTNKVQISGHLIKTYGFFSAQIQVL